MTGVGIYTFGFVLGFIAGAVFMALIRFGKSVDDRLRHRPNRNGLVSTSDREAERAIALGEYRPFHAAPFVTGAKHGRS